MGDQKKGAIFKRTDSGMVFAVQAVLKIAGVDADSSSAVEQMMREHLLDGLTLLISDSDGLLAASLSLTFQWHPQADLTLGSLLPESGDMSDVADELPAFGKVIRAAEGFFDSISSRLGTIDVHLTVRLTSESQSVRHDVARRFGLKPLTDIAEYVQWNDSGSSAALPLSVGGADGTLLVLAKPARHAPELLVGDVAEVVVYLDTDDPVIAEAVFQSVDAVMRLMGYSGPTAPSYDYGSILRRSKAIAEKAASSAEVQELVTQLVRSVELRYSGIPQADVDSKEAEAAARLIESVREIERVCIKMGSILLLKYEDDSGPVVLCRNLSQVEMRTLEKYPEIQKNPGRALELLVDFSARLEPLDEEPDGC